MEEEDVSVCLHRDNMLTSIVKLLATFFSEFKMCFFLPQLYVNQHKSALLMSSDIIRT